MHSRLSNLITYVLRNNRASARPAIDPTEGEVMARRAFAVSRLTPPMMIANLLNAFSIPLVLHLEDQSRLDAYIWAIIVGTNACYFLFQIYRRRNKPFPKVLSQRVHRRAVIQAALLGALWAYPGLVMLPHLEGLAQAFLCAMAAGMVAGGAITLYPIPAAAYAFCGTVVVGSLAGFSRTAEPAFWGYALVSATFALIIYRSIARHERIFVSEFRLRKLLDRRNDHMGEMLEQAREEVRTERQLAEKRMLQTQKMEAIGQLTAGIAHDFNNLLTAVRGNAELLKLENDAQSDLIDPIIQSADSGAALVRQLLAFARKQTLAPAPVNTRQAISETAALLRRSLREDITVETQFEGTPWPIRIDPHLLSNALLNLGTNARDAMPQAGTITISTRNLAAESDFVRVSFCDTGTGMPEHVRERAIEPFFTTKEFGAGSGLGLSMVYGFVKQSGGDMSIEHAASGGVCVRLDLPRSYEMPDTPDDAPAPEGPAPETQSILLIEDNQVVMRTLLGILQSLGYAVTAVESVESARKVLADENPDILITDIVLPGGQWGSGFAREMAKTRPQMRILMISGFHSELASLGLEPHQGTLLAKPFSREQLEQALRTLQPSCME
ncbi:ATP-binding protein [Yoonia sp. BS5-3]|uniref:histidine kinase n=1 Tax=Yoonia phaeophyticola TaxID=3137369 RepID=A0ABZ2V2D5_9RHOB